MTESPQRDLEMRLPFSLQKAIDNLLRAYIPAWLWKLALSPKSLFQDTQRQKRRGNQNPRENISLRSLRRVQRAPTACAVGPYDGHPGVAVHPEVQALKRREGPKPIAWGVWRSRCFWWGGEVLGIWFADQTKNWQWGPKKRILRPALLRISSDAHRETPRHPMTQKHPPKPRPRHPPSAARAS